MQMQDEYFEKLLDQRFENVYIKLDHILAQTTKTNGQVQRNTGDIEELMEWKAESDGHWKGVTKTVYIVGAIVGLLCSVIIAYLWH